MRQQPARVRSPIGRDDARCAPRRGNVPRTHRAGVGVLPLHGILHQSRYARNGNCTYLDKVSLILVEGNSQTNENCRHGISKPVVDRDFFYHRTEDSLRQKRPMATVELESNVAHRCLKCKGEYSLRVRFKRDLMQHLGYGYVICLRSQTWGVYYLRIAYGHFRHYRHKISLQKVIEGEHWVKVKPFNEDEA